MKQTNAILHSAKKYLYYFFVFFLTAFCGSSCHKHKITNSTQPDIDTCKVNPAFENIRERGDTLIALMLKTPTSYFMYKGQTIGYEYELLEKFTERYHLHLQIKLIDNQDSLFIFLKEGKGDLIATCLPITKEKNREFNFTKRFYQSPMVLVQKKPQGWYSMPSSDMKKHMIRNILNIDQEPISVSKDSLFYSALLKLEDVVGDTLNISFLEEVASPFNLFEKIANGEIKYTIADKETANIYAAFNTDIDAKTVISMPHPKAWVVRKNSPELLSTLNAWLNYYQRYKEYYYLYDKYFNNRGTYKKIINYQSTFAGQLSPYDDIIKEEAQRINWDWRLLAAQMYQESHFDPNLVSPKGAIGLMQIMPETAEMHGFQNIDHVETNIKTGISHLSYIEEKFNHLDSINRIKFTLAAYNVGLGHIYDAQRLATYLGLDSTQWDGNVAEALLLKSNAKYYNLDICRNGYCRGSESYNYVNNIIKRYNNYLCFVTL